MEGTYSLAAIGPTLLGERRQASLSPEVLDQMFGVYRQLASIANADQQPSDCSFVRQADYIDGPLPITACGLLGNNGDADTVLYHLADCSKAGQAYVTSRKRIARCLDFANDGG